ncbi:hypothetical protein [Shewanella violacea]|uniref:hypothetical protein n=1 Tax=Shewanella violacea TaxID=60217 RepID=UPI00059D3785|nr:hypothetical protein [Shewanella violacea]
MKLGTPLSGGATAMDGGSVEIAGANIYLSHGMNLTAFGLLHSPCEKVISKAVKRKNPQHKVLGIYRLSLREIRRLEMTYSHMGAKK